VLKVFYRLFKVTKRLNFQLEKTLAQKGKKKPHGCRARGEVPSPPAKHVGLLAFKISLSSKLYDL
jgi:hypothetical protein